MVSASLSDDLELGWEVNHLTHCCGLLGHNTPLTPKRPYTVALFRQPYAMSQIIIIHPVAFIFGRDFVLMTGESNHSFSLFLYTQRLLMGLKSGLWWPIHVWKWLLMLPDTHVSSCSTLSQLEPDESWHCCPGICLSHQGRKNPIDGITWSIQYIQELCWLAVPRPDQLKQPQIITLQFADLNRNGNFFLTGSVLYCTYYCTWYKHET